MTTYGTGLSGRRSAEIHAPERTVDSLLAEIARRALTDPMVELLDLMRGRAPMEAQSGAGTSVLGRLISEHKLPDVDIPKISWRPSARLRVRTRNVLRRWASAQTNPRLSWVSPLAPLGNLQAIASVLANMYERAAGAPQVSSKSPTWMTSGLDGSCPLLARATATAGSAVQTWVRMTWGST
jgi:hypothetical protein